MAQRRKPKRGGFESIQDELATIRADVASLGNTLGDVASAEARETIKAIRERLDRLADDAGSATRAGVDMMEETIEERPLVSVAVAFGLGVVLATLMRR